MYLNLILMQIPVRIYEGFGSHYSLKGQCHELDIFLWRSKHFNQYFLFMRRWFSRSFKSIIINFLFASLKLLTNFENAFWNPLQNSLICDWSMMPTCHWLQGKCARINLSQAAFDMNLQNQRGLPVSTISVKIAALESLKRVIGRIFKISK